MGHDISRQTYVIFIYKIRSKFRTLFFVNVDHT